LFDNRIKFAKHLMVSEPNDVESNLFKPTGSSVVFILLLVVTASVDFHHLKWAQAPHPTRRPGVSAAPRRGRRL
jgi:hypothetical protein